MSSAISQVQRGTFEYRRNRGRYAGNVADIRKDPLYDEEVKIEMDPEEALKLLLQVERCEDESDS